jgi:hypothetical protein
LELGRVGAGAPGHAADFVANCDRRAKVFEKLLKKSNNLPIIQLLL